jgi:hypothetical protein
MVSFDDYDDYDDMPVDPMSMYVGLNVPIISESKPISTKEDPPRDIETYEMIYINQLGDMIELGTNDVIWRRKYDTDDIIGIDGTNYGPFLDVKDRLYVKKTQQQGGKKRRKSRRRKTYRRKSRRNKSRRRKYRK